MSAYNDLAKIILDLERRLEQLDRRLNNLIREARVTEVDVKKGLAKVEAHELKSSWSPWLERAGAIRTWSPPTVGERVIFISPTGEPGQGLILTGGYSDRFKQPHDKEAEDKLQVGEASILVKKGEIALQVADKRVVLTASEIVTYGRTRLNNGSRRVHRIGDVDSDGDVASSGADAVFA